MSMLALAKFAADEYPKFFQQPIHLSELPNFAELYIMITTFSDEKTMKGNPGSRGCD